MNKSKIKRIYQICITALTAFFLILAIYIFIASAIATKNNTMANIFGYTYSVVPTNSMEPDINVGDSVIGKKVKYDTLKIGDDIIYYNDIEGIFIVHRIIQYDEGEGFLCQGTNNLGPDNVHVTEDNFIAKVIWSGKLANIGSLVINNRGTMFLVLIAILMLIATNGIFDIIKVVKGKKDEVPVEEKEEEPFVMPTEEELRRQIEEELRQQKNSDKS